MFVGTLRAERDYISFEREMKTTAIKIRTIQNIEEGTPARVFFDKFCQFFPLDNFSCGATPEDCFW